MSVPLDVKLRELPKFHKHTNDVEWSMTGVGKGRERELLENYPRVARAAQQLKEEYRVVIEDICERMANGMCDFLQRPVVTKEDYNLYCHYVAGLVGHGLTRLFANCDFEDSHLADDLTNSNHMGLFLQKTNIIRDYFEDILEEPPRMFWPKEIWGQYGEQLQDFKDRSNEKKAVECLNAMVADAVQHIPYVIEYLKPLRDPSIFRFCAIPQVMAIGTLAEVYNNAETFHVKVKMSRGASCRVMVHSTDLYNALGMFAEYCDTLLAKLDPNDVSTPAIRKCLEEAKESIESLRKDQVPVPYMRSLMSHYPGLGVSCCCP
ncbi:farnesyl-diphosphate farnesyltransferase [Strigomonas culicis]|uniref:Squalene synthase n=1 Tax=Strigomonas culicis TaxID=28005 RepID=S9WBE5_9TRYP|nr:farnesyl-diphosphate farnesyltransferase [Strigomonas culicis]|eukprot:EPY33320.1 farnesyl-diphosphate farnesyltransferase [Strigomonas culicis]